MSSPDEVPNYSGEQKAAILREHLVDGLPIIEVCCKYRISAPTFSQWLLVLFENSDQLFERKPNAANVRRREAAAQKKVARLEAELQQKYEVIAELLHDTMLLTTSHSP